MAKVDKFRRDPELFFRDSERPLIRLVGRATSPLLASEAVRDLIREPLSTLARVPWLGAAAEVGQRLERRSRWRLLSAHGRPRVSVVLAAWNAADSLARSLRSLSKQTYSNLEIIVVDDGSSDATAELAARTGDERVIVHRCETNRGAAFARNLGLAAATGDFVTFQDADDRSHRERIEIQLAALLAAGDAVMSVCSYQRVTSTGRPLQINGRRVGKCIISMLFRRELVLGRVGYLRDLRVSEDAEYHQRIRAAFGISSEVTVLSRLYFATFRASSLLFGDGEVEIRGDQVCHRRSAEADEEWRRSLETIGRIRAGDVDPYVARWP